MRRRRGSNHRRHAGVFTRSSSGLSGTAGVLTMSLGGLLLVSHFYAEFSTAGSTLLALSLVAAAGLLPARLSSGPAWRQAIVRTAICLAPLVIALASRLYRPAMQ